MGGVGPIGEWRSAERHGGAHTRQSDENHCGIACDARCGDSPHLAKIPDNPLKRYNRRTPHLAALYLAFLFGRIWRALVKAAFCLTPAIFFAALLKSDEASRGRSAGNRGTVCSAFGGSETGSNVRCAFTAASHSYRTCAAATTRFSCGRNASRGRTASAAPPVARSPVGVYSIHRRAVCRPDQGSRRAIRQAVCLAAAVVASQP